VVDHVVARRIVDEHATHPSQEVPIHRSSSPACVGPLLSPELRHSRLRVLHVGDHRDCPYLHVNFIVRNQGRENEYVHQPEVRSQGMMWYFITVDRPQTTQEYETPNTIAAIPMSDMITPARWPSVYTVDLALSSEEN